ncbi:MAG TPA: C1 family peptidase [Thermoanaerobaculia bacterium]|nr:C1 family peptidase [Thermoanaerobaculia bacterium]
MIADSRRKDESFLDQLVRQRWLTPWQAEVLAVAQVDSVETLWAVLVTFPSLGRIPGFDLPGLTNRLARGFGAEIGILAESPGAPGVALPAFAFGCEYPGQDEPAAPGWEVPLPAHGGLRSLALQSTGAESLQDAIDVRCGPWPVRDQGERGACIAFATVACREQLECRRALALPDLSEQYFYWALKARSADPWPESEGSLLRFAQRALASEGVCTERLWPYNPARVPGNVPQAGVGGPTPAARADAPLYAVASRAFCGGTSVGNATRLYGWLKDRQRAVAISLPVFSNPRKPRSNNWGSLAGWRHGRVLDPPPTATSIGGHTVCVTGFRPDRREPLGGYFVIRNSWGPRWGKRLPNPEHAGPEPGYGQVSATYVERFLWEMLQL